MPGETSQTLDRGLRALELLAAAPSGLTGGELAEALGVPRTVAYRLVNTLVGRALVRRDATGRLTVGLGVLALAGSVAPVLRDTVTPLLRSLAEDVGCTAHLTVVDAGEALALVVVEPSWTDFHVGYRVGARHPLDRGAAGRAILAGRRPDPQAAPYVVTEGELQSGARGVAAPVLGVPGLEASVGIVTLGPLDAQVVGLRVAGVAAEIAELLAQT